MPTLCCLTRVEGEVKVPPLPIQPDLDGPQGVSRDGHVAHLLPSRPLVRRRRAEDVAHVGARVNDQSASAHPNLRKLVVKMCQGVN